VLKISHVLNKEIEIYCPKESGRNGIFKSQ